MKLSRSDDAIHRCCLAEVASISTGYSYRGGFVASEDGLPVIQLRDLDDSGNIGMASLLRGGADSATDVHFVKPENLIFRSRGTRLTASLVPAGAVRLLLAAPLLRIEINTDTLLPGYLAWYINSRKGQDYVNSRTKGSTVRMIDIQAMREMPVPVPPLEVQHAACTLIALRNRESELSAQLLERRAALIEMVIDVSLNT